MDKPSLSVAATSMAAWKSHKASWIGCQKCPLSKTRHNVVMLRGLIPADILFIGEAPGESEDIMGRPFVGPSGIMLEDLIVDGWLMANSLDGEPIKCPETRNSILALTPRMAITNIVACLPITDIYNLRKPTKEEVLACRPRLFQLIDLVKPRLIITVGQIAKQFLPPQGKPAKQKNAVRKISPEIKIGHILHPSAILRANGSRADLDYKRVVHILSSLFKGL